MSYRLSARALRDLDEILDYSTDQFGPDAALRYELLLTTAIEEVGNEPFLPGSKPVRRRPDLRTYNIASSKRRIPAGRRVSRPSHRLVYRIIAADFVEILGITGQGYPVSRLLGDRPDDPS